MQANSTSTINMYIVLSETSCNTLSPIPLSPYKQAYNAINPISCCGRSLLRKILIKIQKLDVHLTQDGSPQLQGMDLHRPSPCQGLGMYLCVPSSSNKVWMLINQRWILSRIYSNIHSSSHNTCTSMQLHKPGLQSGPALLLASRLGFALGQSCFA